MKYTGRLRYSKHLAQIECVKRGTTLEKVGEKAGIANIYRFDGEGHILSLINDIAEALGCDTADLLESMPMPEEVTA